MSYDLQQRQEKIQEKRKQTPWRNFVMEICSRMPLVLYKNHGLISRYPENGRMKMLQKSLQYEADRDTFTKYGITYDSSTRFVDQLQQLIDIVPFPSLTIYGSSENSDYADAVHNTKNAYLVFNSVRDNENILYSTCVKDNCRNILGSLMVWDGSQNIYNSSNILKSYNVFFSRFLLDCSNIRFSTNLIGCSECILCDNLINQSYCINNVCYEKDEYMSRKIDILLNKNNMIGQTTVLKGGNNYSSKFCSGNFIVQSDNVTQSHYVYQVKDGRNLIITGSAQGDERMYDVCIGGSGVSYDYYGACMAGTANHIYLSESIGMSSNIFYSRNIQDCSFCLGCIGLKNKSYCILNKQYTKEERYEKVDEIFSQMEKDGQLGEFFPASMNPFYFNDTAAYLIDPSFTKEEVTAKGYLRRDEPIKVDIPEGAKVVKTQELDQYEGRENDQRHIDPEILKVIIQDDQGNVYKIVKMEYDFLMKYGLPLPRKHWLDRMKENFRI